MRGITSLQGPHQVAQKSMTTTFPRYSESECTLPSASLSCQSGALSPTGSSFISCSRGDDFGAGAMMIGPCATTIGPGLHRPTINRATPNLFTFSPFPLLRLRFANGKSPRNDASNQG